MPPFFYEYFNIKKHFKFMIPSFYTLTKHSIVKVVGTVFIFRVN
jgi:hypothetical protein